MSLEEKIQHQVSNARRQLFGAAALIFQPDAVLYTLYLSVCSTGYGAVHVLAFSSPTFIGARLPHHPTQVVWGAINSLITFMFCS